MDVKNLDLSEGGLGKKHEISYDKDGNPYLEEFAPYS